MHHWSVMMSAATIWSVCVKLRLSAGQMLWSPCRQRALSTDGAHGLEVDLTVVELLGFRFWSVLDELNLVPLQLKMGLFAPRLQLSAQSVEQVAGLGEVCCSAAVSCSDGIVGVSLCSSREVRFFFLLLCQLIKKCSKGLYLKYQID